MTGRIFREFVGFTLIMGLAAAPAFCQTTGPANGNSGAEACRNSPICAWGKNRNAVVHEERRVRERERDARQEAPVDEERQERALREGAQAASEVHRRGR